MLEHTFCHIPGIGQKAEQKLWAAGIIDWDAALHAETLPGQPNRADMIRKYAAQCRAHLDRRNALYFCDALASREHWRLFPHFNRRVAYLDIETTGTQPGIDYITTICLYDGNDVQYYVHGANLDDFARDIRQFELIVTYNGKTFDLPFIRHYLGVEINAAHIDLRYVLASLGFKGGLKGCEKQMGIARNELDGVDGYFAVLLWYEFFNRGNRKALETLIAYNMMDVINLEHLMFAAYNMKIAQTPFNDLLRLDIPIPPGIPFSPDLPTIERIPARMPRAF